MPSIEVANARTDAWGLSAACLKLMQWRRTAHPSAHLYPRTAISDPNRWVVIKEGTSPKSDDPDCPKTFFLASQ